MRVIVRRNMSKKELVNIAGGNCRNMKDLAGQDSVSIYGAATLETVDNATGEVKGAVAFRTVDGGLYIGISKNLYNSVETMCDMYTTSDFKAGIAVSIEEVEGENDRNYLRMSVI